MNAPNASEEDKIVDYLAIENENQQKEWEEARGVLKEWDERLHDLRKYGFSFLTALLAADSILTQVLNPDSSTSATTPDKVKLAVFAVTLILIVALHFLDKNYIVFQEAALTRAQVLERKLNLEISETIKERYRREHILERVTYIYILFIVGVGLLGGFILYPNWNLIYVLVICSIAALAFIFYQNMLKLRFKKYNNQYLEEDWTISPLECTPGETIRITLNNLGDAPILFKEQESMWVIKDEDEVEVYKNLAAKKSELRVDKNHVWILKASKFGVKEGVYRLQPRGWTTPLPISIIVHELPKKDKGDISLSLPHQ